METEEEVLRYLESLEPEERNKVIDDTLRATKHTKFIPNPGPQTEAYYCKADELLYGGSAGAGKTGLINGLALSSHHNSHIFRRKYADLSAIAEDLLKMYGSRKGYTTMPRPKLRTKDERLIEFGACQHDGDEQAWQGQAADLKAFDEVTQFLEKQVRYIITWNRLASGTPRDQRCRVVFATNPPTSATGDWIIRYFAPWLDMTHPDPAEPGELRWVVSDPDGNDFWVDGPEPYLFPGETKPVKPKSRTFIPGKLSDNPYLINTDYSATLDALPEPLRSAMRDGNFMAARDDAENQVIPTQWIVEAQNRWKENPPPNTPMSAMALDSAQGGKDENVIITRFDWWFSRPKKKPGKETPLGTDMSGPVIQHRQNNCPVNMDVGGGYGGATYKVLKDNGIKVYGHKGQAKSTAKTKDSKLKFVNKRAEAWWRLREALDPSQHGGSKIALPPEAEVKADLSAPTFEMRSNGLILEDKKKLKKRIGRSPDVGDTIVLAWEHGDKGTASSVDYGEEDSKHGRPMHSTNNTPKVNLGRDNRRRR